MLGQDQDSVGGGLESSQRFIGSMDEVALYNGVLSATQVKAHYNAAAHVTVVKVAPTNLAWSLNDYDINEGQSTSVSGTFADPGTLDVRTVTINWGDGSPVTYMLPVGDTLSATSLFANGLVHLTGTYHDDGSQDTHSLMIDWGDGSPLSTIVAIAGLLMGTHVYTSPGNDTISVTLTDDDTGATSASTSVVVVLGRSLTGSVYVDADNDGVRDIGESGLFDVR